MKIGRYDLDKMFSNNRDIIIDLIGDSKVEDLVNGMTVARNVAIDLLQDTTLKDEKYYDAEDYLTERITREFKYPTFYQFYIYDADNVEDLIIYASALYTSYVKAEVAAYHYIDELEQNVHWQYSVKELPIVE